jgi:poly(hydroxyalkanoate) depolymerase family esterase
MTIRPKVDMAEATRLTRQGRLEEAMAVLRGALPVAERSAAARSDGDAQHQANSSAPTFLDMVPPSMETGPSWTAPPSGEGPSAAQRGNIGRSIPPMSHGFLNRLRKFRSADGFDGLTGRAVGPAPVALPDGATFGNYSFANEAGHRTYKLYVPSRFKGEALPLVVMLHGCTQSPDDFAAGTRMNELAEEQMFLVAYPAQPQSANASKCWNWFNGSDQRRDCGEPSLIAGITLQIMRDFPIETGRVYVAGLSAGGAAAAIMGTTYPDLYAAIGVHSGLACGAARDMPSAFAAMRQGAPPVGSTRVRGPTVPTIVFHGDGDKTVNPLNGDQVIAQSKPAMKLQTTVVRGKALGGISYTHTIQTDDAGRSMLEQWVLHGVGHAWSGGSTAGSYTEPRGPDASREMVRFFLQQPSQP